jgi:hypothetical protein
VKRGYFLRDGRKAKRFIMVIICRTKYPQPHRLRVTNPPEPPQRIIAAQKTFIRK